MINFKLEKFEGPLGLLLQLIEKQELDITEISLAKIADQYIEYIKNYKETKPEETADFLVVAAKLLLIKSKALLPFLKYEQELEVQEFENQLKMYKEFLDASKKIEAIINKKRFSFAREFNNKTILANSNFFSPPKKIIPKNLYDIFNDIVKNIKPIEKFEEEKLEEIINIEDKILAIQQVLLNKIKISFNHIISLAQNKTEIIVSFLALLELIKQKNIAAAQANLFGEINIIRLENCEQMPHSA